MLLYFIPTGGVGGDGEGGSGGGEGMGDGTWDASGMETEQTQGGPRPGSKTPFSRPGSRLASRPKSTMRGGHRKRGVNLEVSLITDRLLF